MFIAGFSANKDIATYKVEDEKAKLTIEEMNAYVCPQVVFLVLY